MSRGTPIDPIEGAALNATSLSQASGTTLPPIASSQSVVTDIVPVFDFYSGLPRKPSPFLQQTIATFEKYIGESRQWIQELEQVLCLDSYTNSFNSSSSVLQSLPKIMSNVHDFFVHTAEKVLNCRENKSELILGTVIPGAVLIICLIIIIIWRRKKWSNLSAYFLPRKTSSDIEDGRSYYGVPVFSYKDLEEATHNFCPSENLGDGGFGTVYHGKLRDGREVVVKRLYEHNYKRVEQFMNEIDILTRLRHHNLVLLYGSTSHRSHELLLVYEYIPNGTVADHLHGNKAETEPLTWPVRMNIAIETASALFYLHKSDIIHRDITVSSKFSLSRET